MKIFLYNFDIIMSIQQNICSLQMEVSCRHVKVHQENYSLKMDLWDPLNLLADSYVNIFHNQVFFCGYVMYHHISHIGYK